jgi:hypothetical protein
MSDRFITCPKCGLDAVVYVGIIGIKARSLFLCMKCGEEFVGE